MLHIFTYRKNIFKNSGVESKNIWIFKCLDMVSENRLPRKLSTKSKLMYCTDPEEALVRDQNEVAGVLLLSGPPTANKKDFRI